MLSGGSKSNACVNELVQAGDETASCNERGQMILNLSYREML